MKQNGDLLLDANRAPALFDNLATHVIQGCRGERLYTPGLADLIPRGGACPSAGGTRGPLESIMRHMGGMRCV